MSALTNPTRSRVPRIAEQAVERARLAVVPRRAPRPPRVPFIVLVSLLLVGGIAGLLCFNTSMQQASFTATALQDRATQLDATEQSLQMDLERLRNPQRVALHARRMGMVPPPSPAFLRLPDGKVLGSPAAAVAGDGIRIAPLPRRKPKSLRPVPVIAPPVSQTSVSGGHANKNGSDGAPSTGGPAAAGTKSTSQASHSSH